MLWFRRETQTSRPALYVKLWMYRGDNILYAQIVEQDEWLRGTGNIGIHNGWAFVSLDHPYISMYLEEQHCFSLRGNNKDKDHEIIERNCRNEEEVKHIMHDLATAVRLLGGVASIHAI